MLCILVSLAISYSMVREPKESNDVRFNALHCTVFELAACENSLEFPAESGCKT